MNDIVRTCLSLPNREKVELINLLRDSLESRDKGRTFDMMHKAIVKVIGCEVITKSRERNLVIGRTILAYACALEGWSTTTIGKLLNRDHSTISILTKDMREWLGSPNLFKDENEMYFKFLEVLNNETDR